MQKFFTNPITLFFVAIITLLILGITWYGFYFPFNQVKCGDQYYTLYRDIEDPQLMYNTQTNSKMFWKFGTLSKSIVNYEIENGITTMLHIRENKDSYSYTKDIHFIVTNNQISDQEIQNLKACYPDKKFELETNIHKTKVGEGTFEIRGDLKVLE